MGGQPYHPTEVGGCTQFGTTASELCDSLFIDVDLSVWNSEQSLVMQVFNPSEVGCESNTDRTFDLTGPPVISSILPSELCDDGRTFVITGERFTNTSIVTVDGQSIDDVNFSDSTSLSITMPEGFGVMALGWKGSGRLSYAMLRKDQLCCLFGQFDVA